MKTSLTWSPEQQTTQHLIFGWGSKPPKSYMVNKFERSGIFIVLHLNIVVLLKRTRKCSHRLLFYSFYNYIGCVYSKKRTVTSPTRYKTVTIFIHSNKHPLKLELFWRWYYPGILADLVKRHPMKDTVNLKLIWGYMIGPLKQLFWLAKQVHAGK